MDVATIVCKGVEFHVQKCVVAQIGIITHLQNPDDSFIPIDLDCNPEIFKLIVDWLTHHENDENPYPTGVTESHDPFGGESLEPIDGWDREFIERMSPLTFYRFSTTVIDLEVDALTKMVCREMALLIKVNSLELPKALRIEDSMKIVMADILENIDE